MITECSFDKIVSRSNHSLFIPVKLNSLCNRGRDFLLLLVLLRFTYRCYEYQDIKIEICEDKEIIDINDDSNLL